MLEQQRFLYGYSFKKNLKKKSQKYLRINIVASLIIKRLHELAFFGSRYEKKDTFKMYACIKAIKEACLHGIIPTHNRASCNMYLDGNRIIELVVGRLKPSTYWRKGIGKILNVFYLLSFNLNCSMHSPKIGQGFILPLIIITTVETFVVGSREDSTVNGLNG